MWEKVHLQPQRGFPELHRRRIAYKKMELLTLQEVGYKLRKNI